MCVSGDGGARVSGLVGKLGVRPMGEEWVGQAGWLACGEVGRVSVEVVLPLLVCWVLIGG